MPMSRLAPFARRRDVLVFGAALSSLTASTVRAQTPTNRLSIVAPFPPGGPVDTLARMLAEAQQRKGVTAIVENIAGGAGNIGMDKVRRARGDPSAWASTWLVVPAGNLTINPTLMPNFPFVMERDFTPITMLAKAPNVLVAHPGLRVGNLRELLALARSRAGAPAGSANAGPLAYASPGVGSGLHLAGALFEQQTGVDFLHVPYKGTGPALTDVLGGQVPLMFTNLPGALPHIRSGKLVAIGLTDNVRSSVAPDIATLAEQGLAGVNVTSWYGLLGPAGLTTAQVDQALRDAAEALDAPANRDKLAAQGITPVLMRSTDFAAHMRNETAVWARIIRERKITAES